VIRRSELNQPSFAFPLFQNLQQNVYDFYKQIPKKSEADLDAIKLKELKNGRLAMWGVLSLTTAASIPGSVPFLSGLF